MFYGDTGNSTVCGNARIRSLFLHHIDIGLTHRCFLEIFGFWLYWGLALCLSFRAGIYGTKTGVFSRKIIFAIFDYLPAKVGAALRRLCFAAESFNNFVKLILFKLHTCRINNKPCAYRCDLGNDFKSVFLECGACFDNIYYTICKS